MRKSSVGGSLLVEDSVLGLVVIRSSLPVVVGSLLVIGLVVGGSVLLFGTVVRGGVEGGRVVGNGMVGVYLPLQFQLSQ